MAEIEKNNPDNELASITNIILLIFRLKTNLLNNGNVLLRDFGVDSTDWQVLGAIALKNLPMTAPAIADEMGMSRQGTQKRLNKLMQEEFVFQTSNPRHDRSPFWCLTEKGVELFNAIMKLYERWMRQMIGIFPIKIHNTLQATEQFLTGFEAALQHLDIEQGVNRL